MDKINEKSIAQQVFLDKIADVEYQSYYEKITIKQFYQKYLWDKLEEFNNDKT